MPNIDPTILAAYQAALTPTPALLNSYLTALQTAINGAITQNFPVTAYGAVGNGITDDSVAIRSAIAAVQTAGGGTLYFPPGTYLISQHNANPWCLDLVASNVVVQGVLGKSWLQASTSITNPQVVMVRVNEQNNVVFTGLGFDGNWGNVITTITAASNGVSASSGTYNVVSTAGFPNSGTFVVVDNGQGGETITYTGKTSTTFTGCTGGSGTLQTGQVVGRLDGKTGINFPDQNDPKNHGLEIKGATNVLVSGCLFKGNYGDAIWMGHSSNAVAGIKNVVSDCSIDMVARDGITIGGPCSNAIITRNRVTNSFSKGFDTEADATLDVVIDSNYWGGWWNPGGPTSTTAIVVKGNTGPQDEHNLPRKYRITNNTIIGPVLLEGVEDIVFSDNRVIQNWTGTTFAPVFFQFYAGSVVIKDNYVYDCAGRTGTSHEGTIALLNNINTQQSTVVISGNNLKIRGGNIGIKLHSPGGTIGDTGTATAIDATHLTDGVKAWTTDAYVNHYVRRGSVTGLITGNTATVLTIGQWLTPTGELALTPATGTYEILATGGYIDVINNRIDCTDDGNGSGSFGISIAAATSTPGARIRILDNKIRNAGVDAINVAPPGSAPNAWNHLVIKRNIAYDDQVTPTCTSVIRFTTATPANITLLEMTDNINGGGVTNVMSGLTGGVWRLSGGNTEQWAGFGSPLNVITAPIGSVYQRIDGGANTSLYVKESGNGASTGWVAK